MPDNTTTTRDLDTDVRVSVLETQVTSINQTMVKLEEKMDQNYAVLHSRISDMRDDLHKDIETKHDRLIEKLDDQTIITIADIRDNHPALMLELDKIKLLIEEQLPNIIKNNILL
jgi:predicted  nucleic acid-binding Zn-ribbon protein